ncbi:hypothetical protein THIX_60068 [Thiomonas sp. X19]|nr:hypothetical protein THIX_60068 [Thiomonas sp. X19]
MRKFTYKRVLTSWRCDASSIRLGLRAAASATLFLSAAQADLAKLIAQFAQFKRSPLSR